MAYSWKVVEFKPTIEIERFPHFAHGCVIEVKFNKVIIFGGRTPIPKIC